jgi:hypothetical protein
LERHPFETPDLPLGAAVSMMAQSRHVQHPGCAKLAVRCDSTQPCQMRSVSMTLAAIRSMGLISAMSSCDNPN